MRILMLGNSFTFAQNMPQMLARLTGGEVVQHTRGGARLSEQLNPKTRLGAMTRKALAEEKWDYVVLQEMSNGPFTAPASFFDSVARLCTLIRANGAVPILYATWAYRKNSAELAYRNWDYDEMAQKLANAYSRAAKDNGALLAEVGKRFCALSATQNLYEEDGMHPNEAGARIAAETIAAVIARQEEDNRGSHNL